MTLSLPMFGVGLSYPSLGKAAGLAGLMVAGSVFACAVSMVWPEHPPAPASAPGPKPTLGYGVRLGAAGATAAAVGFVLGLEHVGWACAAALLVMRPTAEMQRLRSVGRIIAVVVGALAAISLVRLGPASWVYSVASVAALAGCGATQRSRWYVTPHSPRSSYSCCCCTPARRTRRRASMSACWRLCWAWASPTPLASRSPR